MRIATKDNKPCLSLILRNQLHSRDRMDNTCHAPSRRM